MYPILFRVLLFVCMATINLTAIAQSSVLADVICGSNDDERIVKMLEGLAFADKNLPTMTSAQEKAIRDAAAYTGKLSDREMEERQARLNSLPLYRLWLVRSSLNDTTGQLKGVLNPESVGADGKPKGEKKDCSRLDFLAKMLDSACMADNPRNPDEEKLRRAIGMSGGFLSIYSKEVDRFFESNQGKEYAKRMPTESRRIRKDSYVASIDLQFYMECKLERLVASSKPVAPPPPKTTKIVCKTIWAPSGRQDASQSYVIDFARQTVNGYAATINESWISFMQGDVRVALDRIASSRTARIEGNEFTISGDCSRVENAAF